MKALILNSGIGKRLSPFTQKNPKCFAKLNGKNILEHEIENIMNYDIKDIIITTGPFEEKIKEFMKNKFPKLNVNYVKNPKFESTNAIYSMWLVNDFIDDDILYMHGDMVFDKELLGRLLNLDNKSCVLVNNKIEPPDKDFKGNIDEGFVKKIGVDISGDNTYFLPPIYKFIKSDFMIWMKEIERFVKEGNVNVYGEDAFNNISERFKLFPVYYGDEFCMEIDNFDDLEIAQKYFTHNK